jgi:hypothetical protein
MGRRSVRDQDELTTEELAATAMVPEADADADAGPQPANEGAPQLMTTPVATLVAIHQANGAIMGYDIVWAQGVTKPEFGASILDAFKAQLGSVQRTAEWLARLLPGAFRQG